MFRLATCQDLLELKCKYPDCWVQEQDISINHMTHGDWHFSEDFQWGLKQMGNLLCVDTIHETSSDRLLEVGAGFNLFFDRNMGREKQYWMVDTVGHYHAAAFDAARKRRKHTHFEDGLIGQGVDALKNGFFDITFSISVLEHAPVDSIGAVCAEMYRVLRPGGTCVHSIDVGLDETERIGSLWYEQLRAVGFQLDEKPDIAWRFGPDTTRTTLCQTLNCLYGGWKQDNWIKPRVVKAPVGAILIRCKKPE